MSWLDDLLGRKKKRPQAPAAPDMVGYGDAPLGQDQDPAAGMVGYGDPGAVSQQQGASVVSPEDAAPSVLDWGKTLATPPGPLGVLQRALRKPGEEDPGVVMSLLSPLNIPIAAQQSAVGNLVSHWNDPEAAAQGWGEAIASIPEMVTTGPGGNPLENIRKSFVGAPHVYTNADTLRNMGLHGTPGKPITQDWGGFAKDVGAFAGGVAVDALMGYGLYPTTGLSETSKAAGNEAAAVYRGTDFGVDALQRAGMSLDDVAAKYGDDIAALIESGAARSSDVPKRLTQDVVAGIRRNVAAEMGDMGGIKFAGKTVFDVQPALDELAYGAKRVARALPFADKAERAFSRVARTAQMGDELATASAKAEIRAAQATVDRARSAVIRDTVDEMRHQTDAERNLVDIAAQPEVRLGDEGFLRYKALGDELVRTATPAARTPAARTVVEEMPEEFRNIVGNPDYTTPLTVGPDGYPKRFGSWKSNLEEQLKGTRFERTTEEVLSESGRKYARKAVGSRVEDFAGQYPDVAHEILRGRLQSAIDAGDVPAAKRYFQHLTDFEEWLKPESFDTTFEKVFGGGKPAATVGDAVAPVSAAVERTPEVIRGEMQALLDNADPARITAFFEQRGVTPERAQELLQQGVLKHQAQNEAMKAAEAAAGVEPKSLMGEGSFGYMAQQPPERMTIIERFFPTAAQKARDEVQRELGYNPGHPLLRDLPEPTKELLRPVFGDALGDLKVPHSNANIFSRKGWAPSEGGERVFRSALERLDAGYATQTDAALNMATRKMQAVERILAAKEQDRIVQQYGRELGRVAAKDMSLEDFSQKIAQEVARNKALERAGGTAGALRTGARAAPLAGDIPVIITRNGQHVAFSVPEGIVADLEAAGQPFSQNEAGSALARTFDRTQSALKRQQTVQVPGFHSRNVLSDYLRRWGWGVTDPSSEFNAAKAVAVDKASELFPAKEGKSLAAWLGRQREAMGWTPENVQVNLGGEKMPVADAVEIGMRAGAYRPDVAPSSEVQQTVIREARKMGSPFRWLFPSWTGQQAGDVIENTGRMAAFGSAMKKGLSPEAAASVTDKVAYNYSPASMTTFERDVMRRLWPYYGWWKQNTPAMLELMAKNPGAIQAYNSVRNNALSAFPYPAEDAPDYVKALNPIPTPLKDENGNTLLYNPTPVPLADLARLNPFDPSWFGSASTLVKSPIEFALNREFGTGNKIAYYDDWLRDVSRAPGYLQQVDRAVGGNPMYEALKRNIGFVNMADRNTGDTYLAGNAYMMKGLRDFLPWLSSTGRTVDTDPNAKYNAASFFLGLKLIPADEEKWARSKMLDEREKRKNTRSRERWQTTVGQ